MTEASSSQQYQTTLAQLTEKLQSDLQLPAVIGISGAQGSGKTTLAAALVQRFNATGIRSAAVSLDDYYLSQQQRQQLAADIHPLLAQRGVPGTHHIQQALADVRAVLAGSAVALPQFDKALDQPVAALPARQFDVLMVEGWCLGLAPQTEAELAMPVNTLEDTVDSKGDWRHYVNQQLAGPYADYWHLLKPLIWLQAPDWQCVCRWRAKQEQQLWRERGGGMSDSALAHFMLSFQRLTQASWQQLPERADYRLPLDQQQQVLSIITER